MDAEVTGQALGVGPAGARRALQRPPVQGHVGGPAGRRRACGFLHCAQAGGAADREPRREPRHAAEAAPGRAAGRRHSERGAQGWDRGAALRLGVRAGEGPSRQPRPLSTCPARGPDWGTEGRPRPPPPSSSASQASSRAQRVGPQRRDRPGGPPGQARRHPAAPAPPYLVLAIRSLHSSERKSPLSSWKENTGASAHHAPHAAPRPTRRATGEADPATQVRRAGRKRRRGYRGSAGGGRQSERDRVRPQSAVRVSTRHAGAAGPRAQGDKDAREGAGKPRCRARAGPAGGAPDARPAEPEALCTEAGWRGQTDPRGCSQEDACTQTGRHATTARGGRRLPSGTRART